VITGSVIDGEFGAAAVVSGAARITASTILASRSKSICPRNFLKLSERRAAARLVSSDPARDRSAAADGGPGGHPGNRFRAADLLGLNRNTAQEIRDLDIQVYRSGG